MNSATHTALNFFHAQHSPDADELSEAEMETLEGELGELSTMLAAILPGVSLQTQGTASRSGAAVPEVDDIEGLVTELESIITVVKAVSGSREMPTTGSKPTKPILTRKPAQTTKVDKLKTRPPTRSLFDADNGSDDDELFR